MSIVDDELINLGWESETTPEIIALAEIILQDLVDRGILNEDGEEDEDNEDFSQ